MASGAQCVQDEIEAALVYQSLGWLCAQDPHALHGLACGDRFEEHARVRDVAVTFRTVRSASFLIAVNTASCAPYRSWMTMDPGMAMRIRTIATAGSCFWVPAPL